MALSDRASSDERGEPARARGETDPGADRRDVVERVPDPLELEQDRSDPSELGRGCDPEQFLAGVAVGDRIRDGAARTGPRDERQAVGEGQALRHPLDAAVLVEEPRIDVENQVADDVEAKVARLDHAGVDRADGDLVRIGTAYRRREPGERRVVVDERAERLVTVETDAVQIVGLALVPARGGGDVDDRRHRAAGRVGAHEPKVACSRAEQRANDRGRALSRGVQPRKTPASCERLRNRCAVLLAREKVAHPSPRRSPSTIAESGNHSAAAVSTSSIGTTIAVSSVTTRMPGATPRSRRRGCPTTVSTSA